MHLGYWKGDSELQPAHGASLWPDRFPCPSFFLLVGVFDFLSKETLYPFLSKDIEASSVSFKYSGSSSYTPEQATIFVISKYKVLG